MRELSLEVLGAVRARLDDDDVDIGGARPQNLLRALGVIEGNQATLDELVKEVWPDGPPASAGRSLASHISRLRTAFSNATGSPLIERDADVLRLSASQASHVDAVRIRKALRAAVRDLESEDIDEVLAQWTDPVSDTATVGPLTRAAFEELSELRRALRFESVRRQASRADTDRPVLLGAVRELLADSPDHPWLWELLAEGLQQRGGDLEATLVRTLMGSAAPMSSPAPTAALPEVAGGGRIIPPLTKFIGRDAEVGQLSEALQTSRLVTVTGPAGSGKSRLAIEVARRQPWGASAAIVKLAGLNGADLDSAVHAVFSSPSGRNPGQTGQLGSHRLAERLGSVSLLIFDTAEHLAEHLAVYASDLLAMLPDLRILVTSRRRLGVVGEQQIRLSPLPLPAEGEDLAANPAVALFIDRARRRRPNVASAADQITAIARIVRRLDGVPLAIELAAAATEGLSVHELDRRLQDHASTTMFTTRGGSNDAADGVLPAMSSALQWSHDLLTDDERQMFRRLSVFAGSFTLQGAIAASGLAGPDDGLRTLTRLVDHSLVDAEPSGDGQLRYRLLDTMAAFGAAQLADHDEVAGTFDRLQRFYLPMAAHVSAHINGPEGTELSARMHQEYGTVERLLQWSMANDRTFSASHIVAASSRFWALSGLSSRGDHWIREAIDRSTTLDEDEQSQLLTSLMLIDYMRGRYDTAERAAQRVIPLAERMGSRYPLACATLCRGGVAVARDEPADGARLLARARAILDDDDLVDDPRAPWLGAVATVMQAVAARDMGDLDMAVRFALGARETFDRMGDEWGAGLSGWALATIQRAAGDPVAAARSFAEPMTGLLARNEQMGILFHLAGAGGCALDMGHHELACTLVTAAVRGWEMADMEPLAIGARQLATDVRALQNLIPRWDLERWAGRGRDLSLSAAADLVHRVAALAGAD